MGELFGLAIGVQLICILSALIIMLLSTLLGPAYGTITGGIIGGVVGTFLTPVFVVCFRRLNKTVHTLLLWKIASMHTGLVLAIGFILDFKSYLLYFMYDSYILWWLNNLAIVSIALFISFYVGGKIGCALGGLLGALLGAALGSLRGIGVMSLLGWVLGAPVGAALTLKHFTLLKVVLSPFMRPIQRKNISMDSWNGVLIWDLLHLLPVVGYGFVFSIVVIFKKISIIYWIFIAISQCSVWFGVLGPSPILQLGTGFGTAVGGAIGALVGLYFYELVVSILATFLVAGTVAVLVGLITFSGMWIAETVEQYFPDEKRLWLDPIILRVFQSFSGMLFIKVMGQFLIDMLQILLHPKVVSVLGPVLLFLPVVALLIKLRQIVFHLLNEFYSIYFRELSPY